MLGFTAKCGAIPESGSAVCNANTTFAVDLSYK